MLFLLLFYFIAVKKVETLKRYKFSLAFENSDEEDYVTEKFFQSLVAGMEIYPLSASLHSLLIALTRYATLSVCSSFPSNSVISQYFLFQQCNWQNLFGIKCTILDNLSNINDDKLFKHKFVDKVVLFF